MKPIPLFSLSALSRAFSFKKVLAGTFLATVSSCTMVDHQIPATGTTTDCSSATTKVAQLVCLAEAFKATLTTDQIATVQLAYTKELAIRWSNLPCGSGCRNGLQFSTLTATQQAAALALVKAATGTTANEGYDEAMQIRLADNVLNAASTSGVTSGTLTTVDGITTLPTGTSTTTTTPGSGTMTGPGSGTMTGPGSGTMTGPGSGTMTGPGSGTMTGGMGGGGYSSSIYFIAFLGVPSTTGTWQLQFGGHHLAINSTYENGSQVSATPMFEGVEPKTWSTNGTTYAPIDQEHSAMGDLLASLTSAQQTQAKLSTTFSDVLLGPNTDGKFPVAKQGIQVSSLTAAQQTLVLAAMKPWVLDTEDATAASLLSTYANELASTYIAFSGTGTLTTNTDYIRIDGPSVWIEFVCQSGVVFSSQIHYHTVWRDHSRDYGANFTF